MRANTAVLSLAALSVLAMACAGCDPGVAELEVHRKLQCVVVADRLYLFSQLVGTAEDLAVCLREESAGNWSKQGEFSANYSAVATDGSSFFLFLPKSVIALRSNTYARVGHAEWSFNWRAQSAHVLNGVLSAFGVGGDDSVGYTLYCVSARLPDGGAVSARRESTSAPAQAAGDSRLGFLAEEWRVERLLVEEHQTLEQVRSITVGSNCWLFYSVRERPTGRRTLVAAVVEDGRLARTTNLLTTDGALEFTATEDAGEPAVLVAALPGHLRGDAGISIRRLVSTEGRWLAPQPVMVADPPWERTRAMVACWLNGRIHLFLETDFRVLRLVRDREWGPAETVVANPAVDWMLRHVGVLAAATIVSLVVLGASVVRSRFLPRRGVIAEIQYEFASWPSRGAAYLCDLFIMFVTVKVILAFLGEPVGALHLAVAVFCFELVYFSMLEAHTGKTIGKRIFGIMVVSRNGGYPSGSEALIRNLVRALADSLFLGLGWFIGSVILLNTRGSQRLGDIAAGTYVVREHRKS